jgi:hypothetical protein
MTGGPGLDAEGALNKFPPSPIQISVNRKRKVFFQNFQEFLLTGGIGLSILTLNSNSF